MPLQTVNTNNFFHYSFKEFSSKYTEETFTQVVKGKFTFDGMLLS